MNRKMAGKKTENRKLKTGECKLEKQIMKKSQRKPELLGGEVGYALHANEIKN